MVLLSPEEKKYIVDGAESNIRSDGRERLQYRPIQVDTAFLPNAMGSSRVKIGKTDLVVCVNANTVQPLVSKPNEGLLEFFVDFTPIASPEYEGRKWETISDQHTTIVNKMYSGLRLKNLCICPREKCWKLNIDINVLSVDGNIYDAISFAVKAAMATTKIPVVNVLNEDKGEKEFKISDDPCEVWTPDVTNVPFFITVCKLNEALLVDLTSDEEQCSSFGCIIAMTSQDSILSMHKIGPGSIQPVNFEQLVLIARKLSNKVLSELDNVILKEKLNKNNEIIGFLN